MNETLTADGQRLARFERLVLPHLDAAHNLARWLVREPADAEDLVQDACVRAYRFFDGFHGSDARPWFLTIVRHTCYTWLKNRRNGPAVSFDEETHGEPVAAGPVGSAGPLYQRIDHETLRRALEALPADFREVLVLHSLEGLAYREIAAIADIPIGTVMSRLARARQRLQHLLTAGINQTGKLP
jgi:RNA polymerase sigma-70 factor (ECF subfamily)